MGPCDGCERWEDIMSLFFNCKEVGPGRHKADVYTAATLCIHERGRRLSLSCKITIMN
jgi:hypothetical protein